MTIRSSLIAILVCASLACSSGRERRHLPGAAAPAIRVLVGQDASTGAPPSGPRLSEAAARVLLTERFRAAGLRVRYDVLVVHESEDGGFELSVDGYDPQAKIGYEYVAASEADTDVTAAERAALALSSAHRILVIDEATEAQRAALLAEVDRFLAKEVQPDAPAAK